MRKISEMYRVSGGTCASHKCEECINFIIRKYHGVTYFKCRLYSEAYSAQSDWRKSYPACAWFNEDRKDRRVIDLHAHEKKPETEIEGQMSFEDFPEILPEGDITNE